ncbi:hypothetical protein F5879DRAFT_1052029 [Lentinula edodes]|nr:hypothetical protein F5879DRAFT_1052029 [Lentinula edodes]
MWLRSIFLQLVISPAFWILDANALPLNSSLGSSASSHTLDNSEQTVEDPWDTIRKWNLRRNIEQSWIKYQEKCPGFGENEKYFRNYLGQEHDITGLSMKPLHLNLGGFNGGIYKLSALDSEFEDENRAGPGHVIKLVDLHQEYASCEPYALQAHKIWVQTGFLMDSVGTKWGALQMEEIPGQPLYRYQLWLRRPSLEEKKNILVEVRNQLFEIIYSKAKETHHLLHTDFNPNNVHVVLKLENKRITVVGVRLLDFGYPGIYTTTELPPQKKFRAWFDLRFDLLWDYVYELLGEEPPHYMKYVALIEGEVVEVNDP